MPHPTWPTTATREGSGMAKLMLEEKEWPIQPRLPEGQGSRLPGPQKRQTLPGPLRGPGPSLGDQPESRKPKQAGRGRGCNPEPYLLSTGGSVRDQLKEALFMLTLLLPASGLQKEPLSRMEMAKGSSCQRWGPPQPCPRGAFLDSPAHLPPPDSRTPT